MFLFPDTLCNLRSATPPTVRCFALLTLLLVMSTALAGYAEPLSSTSQLIDENDPTALAGPLPAQLYDYKFGPHPRLRRFEPELFPSDGAPPEDSYVVGCIKQADDVLARGLDVPDEPGNWTFYYSCREHNVSLRLTDEGLHQCPTCEKTYNDDPKVIGAFITHRHGQLEHDLVALGRAYHLSRDAKYARPVADALLVYAKHYPRWTRHDRWGRTGVLAVIGGRRYAQSLDEAYGGIRLARAYDFIADWDGLADDERTRIERDCFGEIVETIYRLYPFYSHRNNHTTWYNAGVAAIATVLGQGPWLERTWTGSFGLNHQLNASLSKDGFWYEGTIAYHFYALRAIIHHVDAMADAGRDLTDDPRLKSMFNFPVNLAYPNGQFPAYNDGDRASIRSYRGPYQWAARQWDAPAFRAFAQTGQLDALPSQVYDDSGYVYLRRGAGDSAVTVALDYGEHGGHHGHPDKLQMVAYGLGQELFLDPGRLTYRCDEYETWTRQTPAHNTVAIDRRKQASHTAKLLHFQATDDYDAAVVASDRAYPGVHLRRAVILFDDAIIDLYMVSADRPRRIDWFLHGTGILNVATPLQQRADPIHDRDGYQHLTDLQQAVMSANQAVSAEWELKNETRLQSWFATSTDAELITGNGIGYRLTDRLHFVMLSADTQDLLVVAVHNLTPAPPAIDAIKITRNKRRDYQVSLRRNGTPFLIDFHATDRDDSILKLTAQPQQ